MNQRRHTSSTTRLRAIFQARPLRPLFYVALWPLFLAVITPRLSAQSTSAEAPDTIHGTVVNIVTHEAIPRALVVSTDGRFAAMTDSQGRFEFNAQQVHQSAEPAAGTTIGVRVSEASLPGMLSARKPGFLEDSISPPTPAQPGKEITLSLVPEAIIAGQVALPTSEPPDSIQLQLYRRQVQDGRAHWIPAGTAVSRSTGEFRFADLRAGTYKLLTRELLDRDPLTFDPNGQLYGYPPVYYQDAADFDSATTIEVSAGDTAQAQISLVRQAYYNVKIAVENVPPGMGVQVIVYGQGRNGPGYALGYNASSHAIEGMLPNGTYTVEASCFGQFPQATLSGMMTLNVKGAAAQTARLALVPSGAIAINVKEEFTNKEPETTATFNNGKISFNLRGPRRYLNLNLESTDDFAAGRNGMMRPPKGPDDDSLAIDNVQPGRYWVHMQSSRGYVASARSGTTDLLHDPLVVGAGGSTSPIEITMRDDFAAIEGSVDGIPAPPSSSTDQPAATAEPAPPPGPPPAHVYCIPMPPSGGDATRIPVTPEGIFASQPLAPGDYRLLAFDREQPQLEYSSSEAMKTYDNMGAVVHVAAGQKEHVTLHLILTSEGQ